MRQDRRTRDAGQSCRRAPSRVSTSRTVALGLGLVLSCAPVAAAGGIAQDLTTEEGELHSDTLVPVNAEATTLLELGDLACLRAIDGAGDEALAWGRAFEAWHEALALTEPGEGVPVGPSCEEEALLPHLEERWPDLDGTRARRTEAIEYAVWRRLLGLEREERRAWNERFAPLAAEALGSAPAELSARGAELRWIEHLHPATEGAARGALELFEVAFEEGRPVAAETWLTRASWHARAAEWAAGLRAVAARREVVARSRAGVESAPPPPAWITAKGYELARNHPLLLPGLRKPRSFAQIEGPPGIALLSEGRIAVQTTRSVWILSGTEPDRTFEPWKVALELGHPVPRTVGRTGRDWFFLPESDGTFLYLVSGRADGTAGNFVQKIKPSRELEIPEAAWSLGGAGLYDAEGVLTPIEEVLGAGLWEFQPGARLAGDLLLVQARQWSRTRNTDQEGQLQVNTLGEARAWLVALDARTGRPRWKRFLCRGTDIISDFGTRFARRPLVRTPGAPPVVADGNVFVGTNLGASFLLELADGRLVWSFRNRRREPETPGWQGGRPAPVRPDPEGGPPVILWAPTDADFLYALRAGSDLGFGGTGSRRAVLAHSPLAIGESEVLVGGEANLALVLGRARARRTLSAHELGSGRRYDSVYLGREEGYLPGALVTDSHVLLAGERGLYRFDRERELYLELHVPLDLRSDYASGGLWTRGETLYLSARGELEFLEITGE